MKLIFAIHITKASELVKSIQIMRLNVEALMRDTEKD